MTSERSLTKISRPSFKAPHFLDDLFFPKRDWNPLYSASHWRNLRYLSPTELKDQTGLYYFGVSVIKAEETPRWLERPLLWEYLELLFRDP